MQISLPLHDKTSDQSRSELPFPYMCLGDTYFGLGISAPAKDKQPLSPNQVDSVLNPNDLSVSDDNQVEEIPIDPRLLGETEDVANVISGHSLNEPTSAMEDALAEYMTSSTSNDESQLSFIRKYSTINIVVNQRKFGLCSSHDFLTEKHAGGSKNPPSFFKKRCPNEGCSYETADLKYLGGFHLVTCSYNPDKAPVAKPFKCTEEGCTKAYDTQSSLREHTVKTHKPWVPKACNGKGRACDTTYLFPNLKEYRGHYVKQHQQKDFEATKCQVSDCKSETLFKTRHGYSIHLIGTHKLLPQQKAQYLPDARSQPFRYPCPISDEGLCDADKIWAFRSQLAVHLQNRHKKTPEQIEDIINDLLAEEL